MRTPEEIQHTVEIRENMSQDFDEVVKKLADEDAEVRRVAVTRLMHMDDPRAVPHLISALEDESGRVRGTAALALGQHDSAEASPALVEHLKDDPIGDVRAMCASALRGVDGEEITSALIAALDDEHRHVRSMAASIFVEREDSRATEKLLKMLDDPVPHVRYAVCDALVMLGVGSEHLVETVLEIREVEEIRDFAEMCMMSNIMDPLIFEHDEVMDLIEEYAYANPEATQRDTLNMLREKLGESVVPYPPDDALLDLAERARMLLESGQAE